MNSLKACFCKISAQIAKSTNNNLSQIIRQPEIVVLFDGGKNGTIERDKDFFSIFHSKCMGYTRDNRRQISIILRLIQFNVLNRYLVSNEVKC